MAYGTRLACTARPRVASPHRAGAAGFVVFCALLGVAVFKGGRISTATASAPAGGRETAEDAERRNPDTVLRDRAAAVLAVVEGHLTLWKIQHDGRLPDFARYPNWEQFLQVTDRTGWASGGTEKVARARIGPYLDHAPVNPFNGLSNVAVVQGVVRGGDELPGGGRAGFVVAMPAARFFVTDASGARVSGPGPH